MNRVCNILNIKFPIIQGGMVWCSGWKLANAVSNAGGLGLIGAGSMYPDILEEHITKLKNSTNKSFGVNIPLMYPYAEEFIKLVIKHKVPIVFTSAGNPNTYTKTLHDAGIKVVHVVSNLKFAQKAENAGVDAIVAEGFEAGGHNGREETTTFVLLQLLKNKISIPIIAAGGIASGSGMLAAEILGAEGVQIGTAFAICKESSANDNFKKAVIDSKEGDTYLTLKQVSPVRMLKNNLLNELENAIYQGKSKNEISTIWGKGKAKAGIFDGDIENGAVEIGQISAKLDKIMSAKEIINNLIEEYQQSKKKCND